MYLYRLKKKYKRGLWFFKRVQDRTNANSDIWEKNTWKKSTRPDQLFLSTAVQLNSQQLKPIYTWFSEKLKIVDRDRIDSQLSKKMCDHDEKLKKVIIPL